MLLENLVHFVGALLKHLIGVLLLCWRRMLRAGMIAFFIGLVATVLINVVLTGQAVPSASAMIVALLLGLALAYGVALTVMVEEMILGVIDLIKMLEGDVVAGAHIAEVVAEREVGQVGQGLRRLIGLPVSERGPARPGAVLPPMPRSPASPPTPRSPVHRVPLGAVEAGAAGAAAVAGAALAGSRREGAPADAELAPTTPDLPPDEVMGDAPAQSGAPVPADRLPRISWTYEHEAVRPPAPPVPAAPTAAGSAAFTPAPGLTPNDQPPPPSPPTPAVEALSPPAPAALGAEATPAVAEAPAAEPLAAEPLAAERVADAAEPVASAEPETEPARGLSGLGGLLGAGALGTLAEVATGVVASHALDLFTHHHAAEPEMAAPEMAAPAVASEPSTAEAESYEDERLAAPVSVTTPEGPAEPAERAEELDGQDEQGAAIAPAPPIESASAPEPASELMGQPAPATTPLAEEPAAPEDVAPLAAPEPDYPFQVMPEPPAQPAPETTPITPAPSTPLTAPQARVAADTRPIMSAIEPESAPAAPALEAPESAPSARADGARRTLPLGGAGSLDRSDGGAPSAPRASAPESGLWERLSSALINRVGAPSGPFAPTPGADQPASDGAAEASESAEPGR